MGEAEEGARDSREGMSTVLRKTKRRTEMKGDDVAPAVEDDNHIQYVRRIPVKRCWSGDGGCEAGEGEGGKERGRRSRREAKRLRKRRKRQMRTKMAARRTRERHQMKWHMGYDAGDNVVPDNDDPKEETWEIRVQKSSISVVDVDCVVVVAVAEVG